NKMNGLDKKKNITSNNYDKEQCNKDKNNVCNSTPNKNQQKKQKFKNSDENKHNYFKESNKNELNDDKIDLYKTDFNTCLENIKNSDFLILDSSSDEEYLMEYNENMYLCNNIDKLNEQVSKKHDSNELVKNKNIVKETVNENGEEPLNEIRGNSKICNSTNTCENITKYEDTTTCESTTPRNNWFTSLTQMAKESCVTFQNMLKIKEIELEKKTNLINHLKNELIKLKEENMKQQNQYQCLEEEQENLKNKLNLLNYTIQKLEEHICELNNDKIYFQSNNLTKYQELHVIIKNYEHVYFLIKNYIKKYASVLYLMDSLPLNDETYILSILNEQKNNNNNKK
ncbi:calponin homology domain-containing protein, putative, partial [Hepatocystis sp. ex Piliocolobus tephrosceles]